MSSNDPNNQPPSYRVTYSLRDRIINVIWAIIAAVAVATVNFLFPDAAQWIVDTLPQFFRVALQYGA